MELAANNFVKSDRIRVIEPTYFTLRFYPDMIRTKKIRQEEVIYEGDNWVHLEPGEYGFFGTGLHDVKCVRLDKPKKEELKFE